MNAPESKGSANSRARVHFLAPSATLPPRRVLVVLEEAFDLPSLKLDGKASWEYAFSEPRPEVDL